MPRDPRTFITVHDGMPEHHKIEALSDKSFRALVDLWCWCSRNTSDGDVPESVWLKRTTARVRDELLEGLAELGVMGKPAQEKFIPAIYFTASRADRLALLQGLVDTDAQVMGGHASFISSSQQLAVDVQRLAWSLGMMAKAAKPAGTRYSYKGEWLDGRTAYRVSIRSDNPQELGLMVSKRADLIVRRKNFIRLRVTSVEQEAEHECVCIKVSHPSSLYVTSDYVLTHNTGVAHTLLLAMARQRIPSCYMALEMGSARLTQRMIGQLGKFNSAMFQYGGEQIRQRVTEARPMLDGLPLWFIDAPGMKFSRLKAEAAQQRMVNGVRVFVLDYWQLVCPDGKTGNKADFLGEVADWCARDAHEHGTTWIVLSQENRAGESLGSDGLARACDYLAQLHKHEQLFHGPGLDGVETLWWDVKFSRDGSGKNIGSADSPVLYISKHGPHLAEIGQHVDAIGSLVAKFNDLHDSEKVAPEVLAHMQNSHRSMGKAMSAHLKASTSYGAKDEGEAGAEETQRAEGVPHKPAGSKLDLILSRMDALESKVAPVEVKPADEGYKPVVVPETPLVAVAKEESVTRAEGGEPVDNDPKEGTPEWEALTEFKRFEIVDRRNTQKHIAGKA